MAFPHKIVAGLLLAGALSGAAGCGSREPADPTLLKIKLLDETLLALNDKTNKAADYKLRSIRREADRKLKPALDAQVLQESLAIRAKTKGLIAYLRGVRQQLLVATGNTRSFNNLDQKQQVAATLGERSGSLASEVGTRLNAYSDYIRQYLPTAPALAPPMQGENRLTKQAQQDLQDVDFATFYFKDTSLVLVLAALSQKEAELLKIEAEALERQNWRVGAPFG